MDNKKVGLIGDLHIGVRNGHNDMRLWIKEYLLNYALPFFKENNITDVFQVGDFYDVRRSLIGEDMWWMVDEFIPLLAEYEITWHQIGGNHTSIRKEELTVTWDDWLERESIAHGSRCVKAYTSPQDLQIGDTLFSVVPWVNKVNVDETIEYLKNTEGAVSLGHYELSNFMMGSTLAKHGTLDEGLLTKFDAVYSGHYHNESRRSNIKYLGTPYALNWGEEEDCTTRGLYTFDTLTQKLDFQPNPDNMSIFNVIEYNYEDIASHKLGKKWIDREWLEEELGLAGSVVKVEVVNRDNSKHYKDFLKAMKLVSCVNYNVNDLTKVVDVVEQRVTSEEFKLDSLQVLLNKIDSTEGENFRHTSIAEKLKMINKKCLDNSNVI